MRRLLLGSPAATGPALRRGWSVRHVTLLQIAALVPPLLAAIALRGPGVAAALSVALAAALGWEALFARRRARPVTAHGATTALILAVMAPGDAALWQIALAASFGAVIGELIFGGRGFGFLNPGLAALAFLAFSFPGATLVGGATAVAVATIPGALLLLGTGFISWRVLVAAAAGMALAGAATGGVTDPVQAAAALAFPLVFLIADPLGAASTGPGRWLYGLLCGALAVLFQPAAAAAPTPGALVFAALAGAIFAPLIDDIVVRAIAFARERRHA